MSVLCANYGGKANDLQQDFLYGSSENYVKKEPTPLREGGLSLQEACEVAIVLSLILF